MQPIGVHTSFDTYASYRSALLDVVACAGRAIDMFDPDLAQTGLESRAGCESLRRFVGAGIDRRVRIVVQQSDHLENRCPRLMEVYRAYSHRIALRRAPEHLQHLSECFLVADRRHLLVRFHRAHARGKLVLFDEEQAAPWLRRFAELWEECHDEVAPTRLGL